MGKLQDLSNEIKKLKTLIANKESEYQKMSECTSIQEFWEDILGHPFSFFENKSIKLMTNNRFGKYMYLMKIKNIEVQPNSKLLYINYIDYITFNMNNQDMYHGDRENKQICICVPDDFSYSVITNEEYDSVFNKINDIYAYMSNL